jgi:ribonuclease Z
MNLTITGYSTALFSTWYLIEELGLLFDCGDGIIASLLHKSRKINHAFISHADRDQVMGLHQFNQLNAREGFPIIHYPKDSGSFPAIASFSQKFDPHVAGTVWKPIVAGNKTWIKDDTYVEAIRNNHVNAPINITKSLGYRVVSVKQKIKAELRNLPPDEIKKIILEKGKEATTEAVYTTSLCFSGDTPVENFEYWDGAKVLIHEATFLGGKEDASIQTHGNKHSNLNDVLEKVSTIKLEQLILGHFSSRYTSEQIDTSIKALCKLHSISIPVYRVLPGQMVTDILKQEPINQ